MAEPTILNPLSPTWDEVTNSPDFRNQSFEVQRKVADDYFLQNFEQNTQYQVQSPEVQERVKQDFFSRIGGDDSVGDPFFRGIRNAAHGLLNIGRLVGLKDEVQEAQNWLDTFPLDEATGKFAESPQNFSEYLTDPFRAYQVIGENLPLTGVLLGVTLTASPAVALGAIFGVEGGAVAEQINDYEEQRGSEIDPTIKATAIVGVGAINSYLERIGLGKIAQAGKGAIGKKIINTVISANVEAFTEAIQEGVSEVGVSLATEETLPDIGTLYQKARDAYGAGLLVGGVANSVITVASPEEVTQKVAEVEEKIVAEGKPKQILEAEEKGTVTELTDAELEKMAELQARQDSGDTLNLVEEDELKDLQTQQAIVEEAKAKGQPTLRSLKSKAQGFAIPLTPEENAELRELLDKEENTPEEEEKIRELVAKSDEFIKAKRLGKETLTPEEVEEAAKEPLEEEEEIDLEKVSKEKLPEVLSLEDRKSRIREALKEEFRARRERVDLKKIVEEGVKLAKNPNEIQRLIERVANKEELTQVEIAALETVTAERVDELEKMQLSGATGEEIATFMAKQDNDFFRSTEQASKSGLTLRLLREFRETQGKKAGLRRLKNALRKIERALNSREQAEFNELIKNEEMLRNPAQVSRFIQRLGNPTFRDLFYEYWYNNILSGIPTHGVNVVNNTFWSLLYLPSERLLRGAIDATISQVTGKDRTIYAQELMPFLLGVKQGFKPGVKVFKSVVVGNNIPVNETTKFFRDMGRSTSGAFSRLESKGAQRFAKYLNLPTNALFAVDLWFKSMLIDGSVNAQSRRAFLQALAKGETTRAEQSKFETDFQKSAKSNANSPEMRKAIALAQEGTFMGKGGRLVQGVNNFRKSVPESRLLIPFVNTLGAIMKEGFSFTPIVGTKLQKQAPIDAKIARQTVGFAISASALLALAVGDMTGAAPEDKGEREAFFRAGKLPWSIKIDGTWFSYRRVEPFGTILGAVAVFFDGLKNFTGDEVEVGKEFDRLMDNTANFVLSNSYFSAVGSIFGRFGGLGQYTANMVGSLIPASGFTRTAQRGFEALSEGEVLLRERGLVGAIASTIPSGNTLLEPELETFGELKKLKGGALRQLLPFKASKEEQDASEQEMQRLEIFPLLPSQKVTFQRQQFELPDEIYRDFAIASGAEAKQRIDEFVASPSYQKAPDLLRKKRIESLIRRSRSRHRTLAIRRLRLEGVSLGR